MCAGTRWRSLASGGRVSYRRGFISVIWGRDFDESVLRDWLSAYRLSPAVRAHDARKGTTNGQATAEAGTIERRRGRFCSQISMWTRHFEHPSQVATRVNIEKNGFRYRRYSGIGNGVFPFPVHIVCLADWSFDATRSLEMARWVVKSSELHLMIEIILKIASRLMKRLGHTAGCTTLIF